MYLCLYCKLLTFTLFLPLCHSLQGGFGVGFGVSVGNFNGKESKESKEGIEKDIQDLVNEYNKKIEAILKEKEGELLTV